MSSAPENIEVHTHSGRALEASLARLEAYVLRDGNVPLSRHPRWLTVLERGLSHVPYCLEAVDRERTCGLLPLAYVRSLLFGRFLVSLPYLNYGGVLADDEHAKELLISGAANLADSLAVRHLELRHEQAVEHPRLTHRMSTKVHMRLALPAASEDLWKRLSPKVRNQVRKGQKHELRVAWGGAELLAEFYAVFSHNMRDLGTPVYGRGLFRNVLDQFPDRAEFCVVYAENQPIASALLLHGWGITEVPSASSLRSHNSTCANMLMYWELLYRAVQRRQTVFDFGRSTQDSSTFRFKQQWGADPFPSDWQYYVRQGVPSEMRRESVRFQRRIRLWQRLPVSVTRLIGPAIIRGIP